MKCYASPYAAIQAEMESQGLYLESSLIFDWSQNFQGGVSTNGSASRHLLDLGVHVDLEKFLGLNDANLFANFQNLRLILKGL